MTQAEANPRVLLTWRDHPAARRPRAAVTAGMVIVAFATVLGLAFNSIVWAAVSILVLLLSLNRFFLPSTYAIDDSGLAAKFPFSTRRIEWRHIRRIHVTRYDLLLAANPRRTWLNAGRELRVPFGDQRPAILELVRSRVRDDLGNATLPQKDTEAAK